MKRLGLLLLITSVSASAQEVTHPTRMNLPASEFSRPDPTDYQLALENGLVAYIAEANQVPLVTLSAFIAAGAVSDEKQGSAETLAEALRRGPTADNAGEFQKTLNYMTAEYSVSMHDEWTEVTLNVPLEDLDAALPLFAKIIRGPAIDNDALERAKLKAAPGGKDLSGESGPALYEGSLSAAVDRFHEVLFKDHPYGVGPTVDDFDDLKVSDVREFHATRFVPANMTLAIAGDIDAEDIQSAIVDLFGDMPFSDAPARVLAPDIGHRTLTQHTFPAEKLQSWLVFGHELPVTPLDDQAALEVMNYILAGGHLYTRMTVETRYRYGYTNDASGFLEDRWFGPGTYTFRSYSRHDVIRDIYENMVDEIDRIRASEVTDEELFVAKGALTEGSFQIRYLDGYTIARNFAMERLRFGDHSRSATYVDRVRAVSADEVLEAAKKYLHPDRMQVVLVGKEIDLLD